ncbi:FkbM family methyltransferase [Mucilaginibacter terrenus]|uniref:FkbM family methyltransferase n=1 Tax=Mucilaginibacter terrenus TaxID=2482727 RepID=A0A3E2NMN3_9SPHI|nr:FkbM family methyltransferase [Mucilaginibacter terrenus]RFZ82232.1 FkbM family methyltransferase [Mucilaginibacter terrenus]
MKQFLRKLLASILTATFGRQKLMFLLSEPEDNALLGFKRDGYLHDIGWVNSIANNAIIDVTGQPLPWVTYPFIHFITPRLQETFALFEFGSGNSTLYYSKRVAQVDSVENDRHWYEKIRNTMPVNVNLFYCEMKAGGRYSRYALETEKKYDVVIVDGRDRVNCCKNSIPALTENGIIVLDDSERAEYSQGTDHLKAAGFKQLDFWGLAPGVTYLKCTSIFYRDNNCLNI